MGSMEKRMYRYRCTPVQVSHTFIADLDEGSVIDGSGDRNRDLIFETILLARWLIYCTSDSTQVSRESSFFRPRHGSLEFLKFQQG
jgi:hypothetical protein